MAEHGTEAIPDHFSERFFESALESGLRATGVKVLSLVIERPLTGGENYSSTIYRAFLKYRVGNHIGETSLIVKSIPEGKLGVLRDLEIYRKETIFYLDVKPKLETVMWRAESPWQLGTKLMASTTKPEPTIVLEDLCRYDFKLKSRQEGLNEDDAKVVLQKLAQYHASSMVMAARDPNTIVNSFPHGLLNSASINAPAFKALFGAQLLKLASIAAGWSGFEGISSKLHRYHERFAEVVMRAVYPLQGVVNVLNHGDLWVNNLLFKNGEGHGQTEVRFIDFQLCFYGSPGFDINYFLNTSLQLNVLRNRREELLGVYYTSLTETLARISADIAPPSFELLKQEIEEREAYGFFVTFGFLPLMAMNCADSTDNSLESFHDSAFASNKINLMFQQKGRTLETLKYVLRRLNERGILDRSLC